MSSRGARRAGKPQKAPRKSLVKNRGGSKPQAPQGKSPAARKTYGKPQQELADTDVYSEEEVSDAEMGVSKKGKRSSRYDFQAQESYEFQLGEDFVDEELDDDEAFNSEDERLYGDMFNTGKSHKSAKGGVDGDDDDVEYTDSEAEVFELSAMLDDPPAKNSKNGRMSSATTDVEDSEDDDSEEEESENDDELPDMDVLLNDDDDEDMDTGKKKQRKQKDELLSLLAELNTIDSSKDKEAQQLKATAAKQIRKGDLFALEDQKGNKVEDENDLSAMLGSDDDDDDDGMGLFSSAAASNTLSLADLMRTIEKQQEAESDEDDEVALPSAAPLAVDTVSKKIGKMATDEHAQALAAPVSEVKSEAMVREIAHEKTKEQLSRWDGVVQKNRTAPQLKFPLNATTKINTSTATLQADFTAVNALEKDLEGLMKEYGFSEEEMRKRERMTLDENAVTMDDLKEKEAKLKKMKALMFYQEQKQKHIAKIKSKAQRKYMKKMKDKNQLSLEELEDIDPEAAEKERMKQEMLRVKERASLAHKNTSKWAKQQLKRGAQADKSTKIALQEQLRIGRELAQKMKSMNGGGDDDDDNEFAAKRYDQFGNEITYQSDDDSDAEEEKMRRELAGLQKEYNLDDNVEYTDKVAKLRAEEKEQKGLFGLAFMQRADAAKKEANRQMIEDMLIEDEAYDSDEEVMKQRLDERTKQNEIVVKQGRKEFGPGMDSNKKSKAQSAPLAIKQKSGFGGGLFDVDDIENDGEADDDEVEEKQDAVHPTQFNSALAAYNQLEADELLKKTLRGKTADADSDNASEDSDEENVQAAAKPAAEKKDGLAAIPLSKKSKKGLSAEITGAFDAVDDVDLDSDEEANPWISRNNAGGASKDAATQRGTVAGKSGKGSFQHDNEQVQGKRKSELKLAHTNADNVVLDMSMPVLAQNTKRTSDTKDERYDGDAEDIDILQQSEQAKLVEMAFSSAVDEQDEFEKLKLKEIGEDLPEEDPFAAGVPGWGSWGGAQVKKSKARLQKEKALREQHKSDIEAKKAAILNARTDKSLRGVLINQQQDTKALKYQIDYVPKEYVSATHYAQALRVPLGQEWNTQEAYKKLNAPAVITKAGTIINPIKWTKSMEKETLAEKAAKQKELEEKNNKKRKFSRKGGDTKGAADATAKKTRT